MSSYLYELRDHLKDSVSMIDLFNEYRNENLDRGKISVANRECPCCGIYALGIKNNVAKCFSCLTSWDVIKFIEEVEGLSFSQAVYFLAYREGLITNEQYMTFKESNSKNVNINQDTLNQHKKRVSLEKVEIPKSKLQSKEVISNVYSIVKKNSPKLNAIQLGVLKEGRNLSDERIERDYFNMPKITPEFIDAIIKDIREMFGYDSSMLLGVPGFYKDGNSITFVERSGLGILMRSATGLINGIQVRGYHYIKNNEMHFNEKKDAKGNIIKPTKYFWISSDGKPYGCSAGSPVDVMFPFDLKNASSTIYITEGKFKEEIITKVKNSFTISVQGVNNWSNRLKNEIDYISEHYVQIKDIVVCFDADMATNFKVFGQAKKMIENELKGLNCRIAIWDCSFGKGIDDLIINNKISNAKNVSFKKYNYVYHCFLEKLFKMYPNTYKNNKKNRISINKDCKENDVNKYSIGYDSLCIWDDKNEPLPSDEIYEIYKDTVLKAFNVSCS